MSQDESQIEQLKKKIFSNSGEELPVQRAARLHKHNILVDKDWEEDATEVNPVVTAKEAQKVVKRAPSAEQQNSTFFKKVLLTSFLVLVLALGFAWFSFSTGLNDISSANIDVRVIGPVSSSSGDDFSVDVTVTNSNRQDLELVDLIMTYPQGTRSVNDRESSLLEDRVPIGTIKSGETIRRTVKSILFGEENARKDIHVTVEYHLAGSNGLFSKDKVYPVYIGSAPVTVTIDSLKEVIPEQENEFNITIKSNNSSIIKNVVLKAEYPFGFEFSSATPVPSVDNNVWSLGDIQPQEERHITVKGKLIGGANEQRMFNFYTGTADPEDNSNLGTVFVTNTVPLALKKPFLGIDLALDGQKTDTFVANAGEAVKGEIVFENNVDVPLQDVVIEAQLGGAMLDKSTVVGDDAYYNSLKNTLTWESSTLSDLSRLVPNASGRLQFVFSTLIPNTSNNAIFKRQQLSLQITVRAKRLNENNVPEEITSTINRNIKIASNLSLDARVLRTIGPFQNTGPIPPMPEQESTYTVMMSVGNSYNTVNNAVFTATLPNYVKWRDITYPNSKGVSYNASTRQITWELGDIGAGTGFASSPKDFAFQVAITPSISQVGMTPILVKQPMISGTDSFTGKVIQTVVDTLDTKMEKDPTFNFGQDKVGGE